MPGGGGALPLDSKVISMLVVFLGYKILILVFFRVSARKICAEMKFWYFLGSTHFAYRVKMKSFRKVFSELGKSCSSNCEQVVQLNDFLRVFLSSMCFCRGRGNAVFFVLCQQIWVFLGV